MTKPSTAPSSYFRTFLLSCKTRSHLECPRHSTKKPYSYFACDWINFRQLVGLVIVSFNRFLCICEYIPVSRCPTTTSLEEIVAWHPHPSTRSPTSLTHLHITSSTPVPFISVFPTTEPGLHPTKTIYSIRLVLTHQRASPHKQPEPTFQIPFRI